MINLDPLPFGRRMIPAYPQPRLSEEVKVLRVESRDFEVEAQKELGCSRAWVCQGQPKLFGGFLQMYVGGDYTTPVI